ncbi:hypothetical protein E5161_01965 [Cohnella pontilimi]|uniref:Uncharacterized protein n=1 Tax=Cohnella pontilimi TaxID=2564100 RepID=A0A4U0FGQ2_9BACL|nr:hypothetical protein [Cohnella pontilimi]TJY44183.1 hypothetical protein E5161_01965 [Cohnella pontilimi]
MTEPTLEAYRLISTPEQRTSFREEMQAAGYYAFFAFIEDLRGTLKAYADEEIGEIGGLLARARADFPSPGRFSPSWDKLWEELDQLFHAKNEALNAVTAAERMGEWQVLLDNPYLPQQVVCYPGLSFTEAAYMYAYFQKDLKPNEILRLQKVTRLLSKSGSKNASIWPED